MVQCERLRGHARVVRHCCAALGRARQAKTLTLALALTLTLTLTLTRTRTRTLPGVKIKAKASALDFKAREADGTRFKIHLTPDQRYMCKATGLPLPLLPVHGEVEYKLFSRLVLMQQQQVCLVYCFCNTCCALWTYNLLTSSSYYLHLGLWERGLRPDGARLVRPY